MTLEERLPDFTGQSVAFYITTSQGTPSWLAEGIVLDDPSFQKQGERLFVVGMTTHDADNAGESDWSDNREACLAWDSVLYYIALPSQDYYAYRGREDEPPETSEKILTNRRHTVGSLITILVFLILLAILVAIIVWIIKLL